MNEFYVYVLFRPWNLEPCYVGKGKKGRFEFHSKRAASHENKHLAHVFKKASGKDVPSVILHSNLDERTAFTYEKALIAAIGRADLGLGPLCNHTDGGDGCSGAIVSLESRAKMGASQKKRIVSEETRLKISAAVKGREISEGTRSKMRNAQLGKSHTEETKVKMKESHKTRKPVSFDSKIKMSLSGKGRVVSDETKEKMRISALNRHSKSKGLTA